MLIRSIENESEAFEEIIQLWGVERKRLGFLPRGAFEQSAERGQLIGAFEGELLQGYLLFRVVRDQMVIVHLCSGHKEKGIPQLLMEALLNRADKANISRISLSCRRDYDLDDFWKKLGFVPAGERTGRGKDQAVLTIWVLQIGCDMELFAWSDAQADDSRLRVAMDVQIFVRICDEEDSAFLDEASVLIGDWMAPLINLGYTSELLIEINRAQDEELRRRRRTELTRFTEFPLVNVMSNEQALVELWPDISQARDRSDRDQVVKAAKCADVFVTMDGGILERAEEIEAICGLKVMRPSALASDLDSAYRENVYSPERLGGTSFSLKTVHDDDIERLATEFHKGALGEGKRHLIGKLRSVAGRGENVSVESIEQDDQLLALSALTKESKSQWNLVLLRGHRGKTGFAALGGLIQRVIAEAMKATCQLVVKDSYLGPQESDILKMAGFIQTGGAIWRKVFLKEFMSPHDAVTKAQSLVNEPITWPAEFSNLAQIDVNIGHMLSLLESHFSPLKVSTPLIRNFLVPIHAGWAMSLFDRELSQDDLLGGDPNRLLQLENAYFRAGDKFPIRSPARILWYVSKGKQKGKNQHIPDGVSHIRACSLLGEVVKGDAKSVYSRFKRLGVYRFENILETSGGKADGLVMAFTFRQIELFPNPISPKQLAELGIKQPFPGPRSVSEKDFESIYNIGMNSPAQ